MGLWVVVEDGYVLCGMVGRLCLLYCSWLYKGFGGISSLHLYTLFTSHISCRAQSHTLLLSYLFLSIILVDHGVPN